MQICIYRILNIKSSFEDYCQSFLTMYLNLTGLRLFISKTFVILLTVSCYGANYLNFYQLCIKLKKCVLSNHSLEIVNETSLGSLLDKPLNLVDQITFLIIHTKQPIRDYYDSLETTIRSRPW